MLTPGNCHLVRAAASSVRYQPAMSCATGLAFWISTQSTGVGSMPHWAGGIRTHCLLAEDFDIIKPPCSGAGGIQYGADSTGVGDGAGHGRPYCEVTAAVERVGRLRKTRGESHLVAAA